MISLFDEGPEGSSKPLYRRLREALEQAIIEGRFEDRRLPSTRGLATQLGISRTTVSLAYQELVAEGYLSSRSRSGFRVNSEFRELIRRQPGVVFPSSSHEGPDWTKELNTPRDDGLPIIAKPKNWWQFPYPFLYGQPSPSHFPSHAWIRALRAALQPQHQRFSLQDSVDSDDPLLIEELCSKVLPTRGIIADPDSVLITGGSQNGLFLVAETLISSGDQVVVEEPGFPDANHIYARAGARLVPVEVDEAGLTLSGHLKTARIVSITPSHQFPTGVTMSAARRMELIETIRRSGGFIVEDDYDSELQYIGRPTPSLRAMDPSGRTIYLGSFSKFLAPGLRIGYVVAAPELIAGLRDTRRYVLRHPSGHLQRALGILIESGDYQRWLATYRNAMKDKWQVLASAMQQHLDLTFDLPSGGTAVWLSGPADFDSGDLASAAAEKGVLVEPGHTFFMSRPSPRNHMKIGFAAIPIKMIEPGIRILADSMASD